MSDEKKGFDALIEAFEIFQKYADSSLNYPTGCEHDVLYVYINPDRVARDDADRLDELGFIPDSDLPAFISYRFGSA